MIETKRLAATALIVLALASIVACGGGSVAKTTPTSTPSNTPGPTPSVQDNFNSVYFVDDLHGWVAGIKGGHGAILATTDGGKTWQEQYSNDAGVVNDMDFISPTIGLAILWGVGEGAQATLLHTTDGQTWQSVAHIPLPIADLQMTSANSAWAFRHAGKDSPAALLHTEDGGLTWAATPPPSETWSTCVTDRNVVWAATNQGQILESVDSGVNWAVSFTAPQEFQRLNENRLACHSGGLVWSSFDGAAGGGGVDFALYRSLDGGVTWSVVRTGRAPGITAVVDKRTAYSAAYCGPCNPSASIEKTTDGGETWQPLHVQPELSLISRLSCPDSDHCWLIGAKASSNTGQTPLILATTDGAKTWVQQYP